MSALSYQVGGGHYVKYPIQPNHFVAANNWDAFAQNIFKYVIRWRDKNGLLDLEKSLHYARQRIELDMEEYHPHRDRRKGISMVEFISVNQIPDDLHGVLLALERWVIAGKSTKFRTEFVSALEAYIAMIRREIYPEDSLFPQD
ncbi:DUF3310 domain-containing protein [Neoaquamicrobium sediminum]|uniref:DUF3310 domain-containing protein n=1 Tax=Neoaquamicrobium sediminum TaxID=1849104 RepID=UPI001563FA7D|nr:DUF3310 domain-containing protein [Mesorhizobium sediminum]NRC54156.1 DUF3310 domain-containing protein [Mesorhizobium sediminum]